MQQMTMDGITFHVNEGCTIDVVAEMNTETTRAKLMCVSEAGAIKLQYIRFQEAGSLPAIVLGSKDDIEFTGMIGLVSYNGDLLEPGEKITKYAFTERVKNREIQDEERHSYGVIF